MWNHRLTPLYRTKRCTRIVCTHNLIGQSTFTSQLYRGIRCPRRPFGLQPPRAARTTLVGSHRTLQDIRNHAYQDHGRCNVTITDVHATAPKFYSDEALYTIIIIPLFISWHTGYTTSTSGRHGLSTVLPSQGSGIPSSKYTLELLQWTY